MKKYLILVSVISFLACSANPGEKQLESESQNTSAPEAQRAEHNLINDNLYSDSNGNLYLKSQTREHFETGKWIDVWLQYIYCGTSTDNGWTDNKELKDVVDKATFHLDTTDLEQGADIYEDKNHRYFHKWMADGGTISLFEK